MLVNNNNSDLVKLLAFLFIKKTNYESTTKAIKEKIGHVFFAGKYLFNKKVYFSGILVFKKQY